MSCSEWKETEIGKIPSHWEVITIDEIADVKGGKRLPKGESLQENNTPYPYIRLVDILNNRVDKTNIMYLTKDVQSRISRYIVEKDDVCLAIVGNTIGLVFYITENEDKFNLTENAARITNLDISKINSKFLFYYLNSKSGQHKIKSSQVGSAQGKLPIKNIKSISIPLPPLNEQEKIADVLSSLDDKIELNNEMNKTLEDMAQSIFKRWFVDFEFPNEDGQPYKSSGGDMVESELGMIPKGWEVGSFSDISEILDSKRIPLSKREREKRANIYPYYGAASLMDYVDDYIFEGIHVLMGEDGTVIDKDGFPILQYVGGKFWVNNHAHVLKGKNEFSNEFVYLYLSNTNVTHLVTGAVQPKINQKNLTSLKLPIPDKNMTVKFNSLAKNIFEYIYEIRQENKKLEEIRSILLPVFMNGTINIK